MSANGTDCMEVVNCVVLDCVTLTEKQQSLFPLFWRNASVWKFGEENTQTHF